MNYKNIFNKLSKISDISCAMNIIFVIGNIRPACWYDCRDLDRKKMNKMLKYLDTFSKYGIKYKFSDETYLKNNKSKHEGPLIYNINILSNKNIKIIENNDLEQTYHTKSFGEILGYTCPLNIMKLTSYHNYSFIRFSFNHEQTDISFITHDLYSFKCLTKNIKNIIVDINKQAEKMNIFLKIINKDFSIILSIEHP